MKRRQFITLLGGVAAWPLAARAQQAVLPVVGWVSAVSAPEWADNVAEFRRGLSETGFVEGRNVAIEFHWAEGHLDRMPVMAADLIGRKVAVIVVGGNIVGVQAAMGRTKTIPIVFTTGVDPIAAGVVPGLGRPGGNVTGFTTLGTELMPKRMELLHEVIPTGGKIALLVNRNNPVTSQADIQSGNAAARPLGLEIVVINGGSDSEIERAFATAVQQRAAALLEGSDVFFSLRREQIAALGLRHALPTMVGSRASVIAGGLMSYGPSLADIYRRAGTYVGRILKGEKPGDLPVQQPTKFDLVINLKTAKALGLMISRDFLLLADEVIE